MPEPTDPTESGDAAANPPAKKTAAKASEKSGATSGKKAAASSAKKSAATDAAAAKAPAKKTAAKKSTSATAVKEKKGSDGGGRFDRFRRNRDDDVFRDTPRGPTLSVRTVLAAILFVGGIAWIAYYYIGVRTVDEFGVPGDPTGPAFMGDLDQWNYAIGFGAILVALIVAAHPSTPLGRGRGVVVGMLGCFIVGLLWICVFYVISGATWYGDVPVFNDLEQKNLIVGIAFMAVGFTFATRWE